MDKEKRTRLCQIKERNKTSLTNYKQTMYNLTKLTFIRKQNIFNVSYSSYQMKNTMNVTCH